MAHRKRFMLISFVFTQLFLLYFSLSLTSAEFKTPKFLAQYIPAGFVIDEKLCSSQNVGMFNSVKIFAQKVNQLPKPFVSPESSDFELGYMETTNPAYIKPMWEEAQQNAENESKTQTNPQNTFLEKETIKGGGEIYWYKGVHFNAQGAKGEASQLPFYGAKVIKQLDKGVLTIKISSFVGERDVIRKCF